jgi:hypothetical protein
MGYHGIYIYGYGSIPINTIFRGMNIHKSQLFWGSLGVQGFDTLPYIYINTDRTATRALGIEPVDCFFGGFHQQYGFNGDLSDVKMVIFDGIQW